MTAAMHSIATDLGLPASDAVLLQMTNNAVFALPEAGVVIRIARTARLSHRTTKTVELARWFAEMDAPTVRLASSAPHVVEAGDLLASIWCYVPPTSPKPTAADLGRVLREFHNLGAPGFPLPSWDPIGDARLRLADSEGLRDEDRNFLIGWCDRLEPEVVKLRDDAGRQLVHGDAHASNLLRESTDRIVLCDFDATCIGPWQVDLAANAVGEAHFGRTASHAALAEVYGHDVTKDSRWPVLRDARELKMIAAGAPLVGHSAVAAAEFANRLLSVMAGSHQAPWTPFASLTPRTSS
jgi:hypothetical protein